MTISPKTEREKLSSDLTKGDEHFKQTAVLTEAENQIQSKLEMNDFPTLQAVGQSKWGESTNKTITIGEVYLWHLPRFLSTPRMLNKMQKIDLGFEQVSAVISVSGSIDTRCSVTIGKAEGKNQVSLLKPPICVTITTC